MGLKGRLRHIYTATETVAPLGHRAVLAACEVVGGIGEDGGGGG